MRFLKFSVALLISASSALAQERQWTLDASEKEAFLVFGVEQTDDVGFSFWCEIGKPKMSIFAPVPHATLKTDQRIHIDLKIDNQTFNIIAKASKNPNNGEASIEAPVAVDGTIMNAVRKAQLISVTALGHTANYPLIDADVEGLLRVCKGQFEN
jgi:hypothetical protein